MHSLLTKSLFVALLLSACGGSKPVDEEPVAPEFACVERMSSEGWRMDVAIDSRLSDEQTDAAVEAIAAWNAEAGQDIFRGFTTERAPLTKEELFLGASTTTTSPSEIALEVTQAMNERCMAEAAADSE